MRFQRDVEPRVIRIAQQHEFAAAALGFDQTQALELADAVIHVDHVIAGLQLREIGKESAGANLAARTFNRWRDVEEVALP